MNGQGAIKGEALVVIVIEIKETKRKMKFAKMLAGAAVIGYSAAVSIDSENALEGYKWSSDRLSKALE